MSNAKFNTGPRYSPNLQDPEPYVLTATDRQSIMAEMYLIDTANQWSKSDTTDANGFRELALIYSAIYDDKLGLSELLLTFKGAVIQMEIDRMDYEARKGKSERTDDLGKRNQMLFRVHKEVADMAERNQQMLLMLKSSLDQNAMLRKENKTVKTENEAMKTAYNAA